MRPHEPKGYFKLPPDHLNLPLVLHGLLRHDHGGEEISEEEAREISAARRRREESAKPPAAVDGQYDTKALEEAWSRLVDRISALEQRPQAEPQPNVDLGNILMRITNLEERGPGASMKDLQTIAKAVDGIIQEFSGLKARLAKAEDDAAYAIKNAIVDARLTEDNVQ